MASAIAAFTLRTTGEPINVQLAGADTEEAVLLFNAERARWVSRETWHPRQDGKLQLDGRYLLKFPYSREPELVMDILRYGADVEVLAPPSLREAVTAQLRDALAIYSQADDEGTCL